MTTCLVSLEFWPLSRCLGLYAREFLLPKHEQGYDRQQVCVHLLQRTRHSHQDHSGLDLSMYDSVSARLTLGRGAHHQDTNVELFGHVCQLHEKLIELLLPICKLSTPREINSKAIHDAVNNE